MVGRRQAGHSRAQTSHPTAASCGQRGAVQDCYRVKQPRISGARGKAHKWPQTGDLGPGLKVGLPRVPHHLHCCVTLSSELNLSESQSPHL